MKFTEDSLIVAPTPLRLAEELAGWFYALALEQTLHNKNFNIAISGGSTPVLFFNHLAAKYGHHIDWNKIHIFWADEKCVPPTSNISNFKNAQTNLLNKIEIPDDNVHRIKGEDDQEIEAARYTSVITEYVPLKDDIPCFDLILLGIGDDGHTASIFSGQDKLIFSGNLVEPSINPQNDQKRITLTPYLINNAKKVAFQVTGLSKADIITDVIHHADKKIHPASHINPINGDMYWFLDAGSAKDLFV
jgi:6-phosphogluconolactonase